GAESVGVLVALLNLIWVPFVVMFGVGIPDKILTIPIFVTFGVAVAHFVWLYRLRVRIAPGQMLGAVFAAMGLQWTVARAVGFGLIKDGRRSCAPPRAARHAAAPTSRRSGRR